MKKNFVIVYICIIAATACAKEEAAKVNGTVIFASEITERVKKVDAKLVKQLGESAVKKSLLDGLIEQQLLLCAIRDAGFEKKPGVLDQWPSLKREMSLKYFLNEYLPGKSPAGKSRLKAEYEKKKEMFKSVGQVRARHILIRTGEHNHADAEAQKLIGSILGSIKSDGSNFGELAQKYSECPSAKESGDLGYFDRGQMVQPFEDAAYAMKKGEYTREPVKTIFGYHLIYIDDVKEPTYASLDDVKSYLQNNLDIADLTAEYGISVDPEALKNPKMSNQVGAIDKLKLSYTYSEFLSELNTMVGKQTVSVLTKNGPDTMKAVRELLMGKVLEDKSRVMKMYDEAEYKHFIGTVYNDFITREYLDTVVLRNISVSDAEVAALYADPQIKKSLEKKFGMEYRDNPAFRQKIDRKEVLPGIRQKLINEEKNDVYAKHIASLKKKYPVEIFMKFEEKK